MDIVTIPFSHLIADHNVIIIFSCRLVKLSSPNLNYFIIIGAVLMYSSIYFYLLPVVNKNVLLASCIVSIIVRVISNCTTSAN